MKQEEIIKNIIKDSPFPDSGKILSWIGQSDENRKEFIHYKNLWALLQNGNRLSKSYVKEDLRSVKRRIKRSGKKFYAREFIKYAAIIIFSIVGGYFINSFPKKCNVGTNEIFVPNGNRSLVALPDGSKAWLTNGSKIVYPEAFSAKTRNVKLEGEAYFTVSHDEARPFIVDLGKQKVKVLGTEFSVVAYPDDNMVQVDLVTGKVQLDVYGNNGTGSHKSYILKPLHSLVFDRASGALKNQEIPDSFYKYWQEGIYEFENEPFLNLAKKIERIYGVEVIFENKGMKGNKFTGAFFVDSNIYTIIETFKRASKIPFEYTIDKKRVYIKNKK